MFALFVIAICLFSVFSLHLMSAFCMGCVVPNTTTTNSVTSKLSNSPLHWQTEIKKDTKLEIRKRTEAKWGKKKKSLYRPKTFASFLPCTFLLLLHKKLQLDYSQISALTWLAHFILPCFVEKLFVSDFLAIECVPFCDYKLCLLFFFLCWAADAKLKAMSRLCILQWKHLWIEAD